MLSDSLPQLPSPILFNCWKHHAGFLREQIAVCEALDRLPKELLVMGTELMDLYTGVLTPPDIAGVVVQYLAEEKRQTWDDYQPWIEANGGYRVMTADVDDSCWTLRLGERHGRYVHVHPGRRTPHTLRVRANVLKTAVMVLAYVRQNGGDPMQIDLINQVRVQYLQLSPMREVLADEGLGPILRLLQLKTKN